MTDPNTPPLCMAENEAFSMRCGAPAVVVANLGERSGPVCNDCANRAVLDGWIITLLPEVPGDPA